MYTRKYLDFQDFLKCYYLKKEKHYLKDKGLEELYFIAFNMNSGRDDLNKTRRK
jgi:hypothetical protein